MAIEKALPGRNYKTDVHEKEESPKKPKSGDFEKDFLEACAKTV